MRGFFHAPAFNGENSDIIVSAAMGYFSTHMPVTKALNFYPYPGVTAPSCGGELRIDVSLRT